MAVVCFHMSDSHSKCEWIEFTNPKAHSAWMDLKKKKARPSYMWSTEHILALKTQNGSKERMDDNISSNWKPKAGKHNHTYIRQSRLQVKKV